MEGDTEDQQHIAETNALKKVLETPGVDLNKIVTDAITKPAKTTYNIGVINRNRIKKIVIGLNVTNDYLDLLDEKVRLLIKEAENRAIANGRKRILARDI